MTNISEVRQAVITAGEKAAQAAPALERATEEAVNAALLLMASRLTEAADAVLEANREDIEAAKAGGMSAGLVDRLELTPARMTGMAEQLTEIAKLESPPSRRTVRTLGNGLVVQEWSRSIGVIGVNFEARPNVVIDIASQLIKSRNAGVLRTGSAALRSATALMENVVAPALAEAGIDADAIQLVRTAGREAAVELVQQPKLIPLVILRGSGDSTRNLARKAAENDVKTLAHADGGGVLYVHPTAGRSLAQQLIEDSLDRLGVCNRLNLLLVDRAIWHDTMAWLDGVLAARNPPIRIAQASPDRPLGYEWALDDEHDATITVAPADGPADAARIANEETSGLAAGIAAEDADAATEFLNAYTGTGAFWNATTRLLDGYKLLAIPETGINLDRAPGPRGPVTFHDLRLRQYVVVPTDRVRHLGGSGN